MGGFGAHADAPYDVVFAVAQVVVGVAAANLFQGGVVVLLHPVFVDKAAQQVLYSPGVGEDVIVGVVVGAHGRKTTIQRCVPKGVSSCTSLRFWKLSPLDP